ncbi:MAG TPA: polyprenyl synthetase family protein [Actinocrinis sp.]|nr:polyprenyl synthetase family protein [Actinocrinis sp.]
MTIQSSERTAADVLGELKNLVDPVLAAHVDGLPPLMRTIARYHFGWDDSAGSGKALRPALAVLGARAAGARGDEPEVLDAACAVELIHNFSLLHDDIMDGDRTRRHRPTAWTVYGTDQALLAGCALHTLAFEVLARRGLSEAVSTLGQDVQLLIAGQSDDLALAARKHATVEECLAMEAGKTASLLSSAAALGARAYRAPGTVTAVLAEYGHHLGMAFQMVDDLLGIWGESSRTGKPVAADLRARKRSAPVVAALVSDTPAAAELAVLYAGDGELADRQVRRAAELVAAAGGRDWTEQRAQFHTEEALGRLDQLGAPPATVADLTGVTRFLLARTW